MAHVEIVLVADEFDQFFIRAETPVDADGPRLRVRLRMVNRDVDLDAAVGRPAEALGDFRAARERRAVDVEPAFVPKADCLYNQRIAFISANRIAIPPGLRIVRRQRTAV